MISIKNNLRKLFRSEGGNIIIFTGIAIFVLALAVGVAIDMSRAQVFKSRVQAAADAANLAAGAAYIQNNCATASDTQTCFTKYAKPKAEEYFAANIPAGYMGASNITVNPILSGNDINLTVSAKVPAGFLSVLRTSSPTVGVTVTSQVAVPGSTALPSAYCSKSFYTCESGQRAENIFYNVGQSSEFGTWTCNNINGSDKAQCCTGGTATSKCPLNQTGTITTVYGCSDNGTQTVVSNNITTACTCPDGSNPPADGICPVVNPCTAGNYPDPNNGNKCTSCGANGNDVVPFWYMAVSTNITPQIGNIGFAVETLRGSNDVVSRFTDVTNTTEAQADNDIKYDPSAIDYSQTYNYSSYVTAVGTVYPISCYLAQEDSEDIDIAEAIACFAQPTIQTQITSDYLDFLTNNPTLVSDPKVGYCPITLVGNLVFDPLKVNIKGGNAKINSTNGFTYELVGPKTGSAKQFKSQGGLNENEAWVMVERDGPLVHDGVINGEDFFTDHYGKHASAYVDLARWFHDSLKKDAKGNLYIPLDSSVENVKTKSGHNPYKDLKLLDAHNNVFLAHDYFDKIYVESIKTSEVDSLANGLKSIILQRALVQDKNGKYHWSVDQWFTHPDGTFTLPTVKNTSSNSTK